MQRRLEKGETWVAKGLQKSQFGKGGEFWGPPAQPQYTHTNTLQVKVSFSASSGKFYACHINNSLILSTKPIPVGYTKTILINYNKKVLFY